MFPSINSIAQTVCLATKQPVSLVKNMQKKYRFVILRLSIFIVKRKSLDRVKKIAYD